MKKIIHILLILFISQTIISQEKKTIIKTVKLYEEKYTLSTVKSRTYIPITIPSNTKSWFISFTSNGKNETPSPLNLLAKVSKYVDPTYGLASGIATQLTAPDGTTKCNLLLTDKGNGEKFVNSIIAKSFNSYFSRDNISEGVFHFDSNQKGNFDFLIYNPSFTNTITVSIEIVAVVEDTYTDLSIWSSEAKSNLYNTYYNFLVKEGRDTNLSSEFSKCMVDKITSNPMNFFYNLTETEKNQIQQKASEECQSQLFGGEKNSDQQKAETYGKLGWKSYENNDIDKCIEYSKKAILLDKNLGWAKANLGLCYLIKNDIDMATDYYVEAITDINKNKSTSKYILKDILKDIDNAKIKYPKLKNFEEIKAILEQEIEK